MSDHKAGHGVCNAEKGIFKIPDHNALYKYMNNYYLHPGKEEKYFKERKTTAACASDLIA
jgi:hypothetical protein